MRIPLSIVLPLAAGLLASACASTSVTFTPAAPPASLCQAKSEHTSVLVLWALRWRPDQKDVPLREVAAEQGITHFFSTSGCFAQAEVRRTTFEAVSAEEQLQRLIASADRKPDRVLVIVIRELGPVVKLLSSVALVEGGTEVVLNVSEYGARSAPPSQAFSVHWQSGGPGVVKGVASLPADMEAALTASLRPSAQ
jgi:hypothetical protein